MIGWLNQGDIFNHSTGKIFNHFFGTGLASQNCVIGQLHTLLAGIVDIGKADQLGSNFTGGVKALVLLTAKYTWYL